MAVPYKWDTKVVFLTPELTKGTVATLADTDALITMNGAITPMDGGEVELALDGRQAAAREAYTTNLHQSVSFEVPLCPPSAAATAPHWGTAARLMSLAETIVATTRVEYSPTLTAQESFTCRFYRDGELRVLAGLMGGGSIRLPNGQVPILSVQGKGAYTAPSAASAPPQTPNYSSYRTPAVISDEHTPIVKLGGVDIAFESLEIDLGNAATFSNRPNYSGAEVNVFNPTGTLTFLAPALGTLNVEAMLDSKVAFQLVHYTAAGTQIGFAADAVQVGRVTQQDLNGNVALSVPVRFTRPASGPAFKLWSGTAPV